MKRKKSKRRERIKGQCNKHDLKTRVMTRCVFSLGFKRAEIKEVGPNAKWQRVSQREILISFSVGELELITEWSADFGLLSLDQKWKSSYKKKLTLIWHQIFSIFSPNQTLEMTCVCMWCLACCTGLMSQPGSVHRHRATQKIKLHPLCQILKYGIMNRVSLAALVPYGKLFKVQPFCIHQITTQNIPLIIHNIITYYAMFTAISGCQVQQHSHFFQHF